MDCSIEILSANHVDAIHALAQHPSLPRTSSVPPDCSKLHVQEWIAGNAHPIRATLMFAVIASGEPVGIVALKRLDAADRSGEISYWIGEPFRGRGYAKSAAKQAIQYAFDVLELNYLHSHYLGLNNLASWGVLRSIGFSLDTGRADLPTAVALPGDRFAKAFPDDCWRYVRLNRLTGLAVTPDFQTSAGVEPRLLEIPTL